MDTPNEELKELYYAPENVGLGWNKLYTEAKKAKLPVTQHQVKDFVSKQETSQLHKRAERPTTYLPFKSPAPFYILQADLMFMDPDYRVMNSGHHIILCVIDIFTRYAWCAPLRTKHASDVLAALKPILADVRERAGDVTFPRVCQLDGGSEFKGVVSKHLKDEGIKIEMHEPGDHQANAIVERYNMTLRMYLERYMTAKKTKKWVDALPAVVRGYNNRFHSGIKTEPANAAKPKEALEVELRRLRTEDDARDALPDIKIGDQVRVVRNPVAFEKGAVAKFTLTTYEVEKVEGAKAFVNDKWHRLYHLQKANEIEHAPDEKEQEAQKEPVAALKQQGRLRRALAREKLADRGGTVEDLLQPKLRQRAPANQLVSDRYGRVNYG